MNNKHIRARAAVDASQRANNDIFGVAIPLLAAAIRNRADTFKRIDGSILCDLGGTFQPVCAEMESLASLIFDDEEIRQHSPGTFLIFARGEQFSWNGPVVSLYTAVLQSATSLESVNLAVTGAGVFEISVYAHKNGLHKLVQRSTSRFDGAKTEIRFPGLDLTSLSANSALYVNARCVSEKGVIHGFRWQGLVSEQAANTGERIYLIRTFNGRAAVKHSLTAICNRLAETDTGRAILKRTLFLIYDASPEALPPLDTIPHARILELRGPNFGGGGNSSFLVSLVLRLGEKFAGAISALLIMDDDAQIDAETVIRQDAFITARKKNIISAAVVYNGEKPLTIQEAGGWWGKFISPATNRTDATALGAPSTLSVFLLRHDQILDSIESTRDLAMAQSAEFAAFIFISFPYLTLLKSGAPYPFFLRNDDVEICLRCLSAGATIAINPNLHAWHTASHNEVSEFYTLLHGLLLNAALGQLHADYIAAIFMERAGKIARAGNCALLHAYALALEKFAEGPEWHKSGKIFAGYLECRGTIKATFQENAQEIPFMATSASQTPTCVLNIVDVAPPEPWQKTVIFQDVHNWRYYYYDPERARPICAKLLGRIGTALAEITSGFEDLCQNWKKTIENFDHIKFWNEIAGVEKTTIARDRMDGEILPDSVDSTGIAETVTGLRRLEPALPPDFNEGEYLRLNPDLKKAEISLKKHWLRYGRKEGRRYK